MSQMFDAATAGMTSEAMALVEKQVGALLQMASPQKTKN
jgi:hypothetical protein